MRLICNPMKLPLAATITLLALLPASAAPPEIRLEASFAPRIDRTDRGDTVRYELRLTNIGSDPVRLQALHVRDATSRVALLDLEGDRLRGQLARDPPGCDVAKATVSPGRSCILYVDASLTGSRAPKTLENQLDYVRGADAAQLELATAIASDPAPVLGPPLGTGTWVAVHSPDWPRGHRRVFYNANGSDILPGRFAIDFVQVGPQGETSCGDPNDPKRAIGYGDPVLAVADARVAAVRDSVTESPTIKGNRAHERSLAAGNYVVLALPGGKFATYEHLRPGSVRVRAGDRIRRGAVIGALGFTGDSTGPHLHFHVSDAAEPLGGEGLPFVFGHYILLGDYPDIARLGSARWRDLPPREIHTLRPSPNSVVSFKGGPTDASPCASSKN